MNLEQENCGKTGHFCREFLLVKRRSNQKIGYMAVITNEVEESHFLLFCQRVFETQRWKKSVKKRVLKNQSYLNLWVRYEPTMEKPF